MAASATRRSTEPLAPCVAVAYSGGRDSTALLHVTLRAARALHLRVVALHVHHGLNANADAWLEHCRICCRRWASRGAPLAFASTRIDGHPASGESVEAWARQTRYRALQAMAVEEGASPVLLAHHRRDQAETFVLQALRGAGVAGLASMPRMVERAGITWMRPWLGMPRAAIEAYVKQHRLGFIDDDSNDDRRYARNRLRREVWPALATAFPNAEGSLSDAAAWAHQAHEVLAELAALDLQQAAQLRGLQLTAWRSLSAARRSNVLRAWLSTQTGRAPSASLMERLMHEADQPGSAVWPLAQGLLHRHRGWLRFDSASLPRRAHAPATVTIDLRRAGRHPIAGWHGELHVEPVESHGVALARLAAVEVRPRVGGEKFQLGVGRPARPLKKQYQAQGVVAWEREGPLLYAAERLIFVPGLGIDARAFAGRGEPQACMCWVATKAAETQLDR